MRPAPAALPVAERFVAHANQPRELPLRCEEVASDHPDVSRSEFDHRLSAAYGRSAARAIVQGIQWPLDFGERVKQRVWRHRFPVRPRSHELADLFWCHAHGKGKRCATASARNSGRFVARPGGAWQFFKCGSFDPLSASPSRADCSVDELLPRGFPSPHGRANDPRRRGSMARWGGKETPERGRPGWDGVLDRCGDASRRVASAVGRLIRCYPWGQWPALGLGRRPRAGLRPEASRHGQWR